MHKCADTVCVRQTNMGLVKLLLCVPFTAVTYVKISDFISHTDVADPTLLL